MSLRRALIPVTLTLLLLVQFFSGTGFGPKPAAAATCTDIGQFVADVTIPDGTTVAPGATFVKTWRLLNAGTCTWTTSYAVVFTGGDQMGAPAVIAMPAAVAPGGTVDINVNLTAPATPGHYRGNYKLKNDTGGLFGVGAGAAFLFWVDINVSSGGGLSTAYDFAAQAGTATWSSGAGALTFPGTEGDVKGFALGQPTPKLENGATNPNPGLLVGPQAVSGGYVQGVYPAFTVQSGDRFQSTVDCAFGASSCYVNFRLAYRIGSGPVTTFWTFNERFEGLFFRVNLDLSSLAGQNVNFILYVADVPGHGVPAGDKAQWVEPRIVRGGGGGVPIPPTSVCDKGAFVGDVTIPDGSVLAPGQAFTKTWRIRNIGSCPWTSSYALVFVLGNTFGAAPVTGLSPSVTPILPVAPGQTADFSLNMVAPSTPGHYRSYWRFQNASAAQFGVGSGMITFFADINVSGTPLTPTVGGPTPTASPTAIIPGGGADLSVTVDDGILTYTPGGTTTYTITVRNNGPQPVTGATFTDNKPTPHVTSWTVSCTTTGGATCTPTTPFTSSNNILDTVNLPVNSTVVYKVVATISASAVDNLVNAVSITNPAAVPDPNLANNSATDTDAPPSANLTVSMSQNVTMYTLGGSIIYNIGLTNQGPLPVTGATFSDPKPVQIPSWVWACSTTGGAVWSGPGTSTGNVTAVVNMPQFSTINCVVTAAISSSATGDLTNTATITSPVGVPDPIPANNQAQVTAAGPNADLMITKTDGVNSYTPNGTLTYTIVVKNNGPLIVANALVSDNIPANITTWTWTCEADTGASCGATGAPSATNFSDVIMLPLGNKVVYTVTATVSGAATGNLVNTATVTNNVPTIPDNNPANNSATDTDAQPSADLLVTVTDNVDIYPLGGTVTYVITVLNNSDQNVTAASFLDNKPAAITSWTWTCSATTGAICGAGLVTPPAPVATNIGDVINIPAHGTIVYTVVASIDPLAVGDMLNTVQVLPPTGFNDPNMINNTAADKDVHPHANLVVTVSDQVPTYSSVGADPTTNYTVIVSNNGPSAVKDALVTGLFPAGVLASWSWTCVPQTGGASCNAGPASSAANFTDLVTIPAGSFVKYTVVGHIVPGVALPLQVTVTVLPPAATPPGAVDEDVPGDNMATDIDSPQ